MVRKCIMMSTALHLGMRLGFNLITRGESLLLLFACDGGGSCGGGSPPMLSSAGVVRAAFGGRNRTPGVVDTAGVRDGALRRLRKDSGCTGAASVTVWSFPLQAPRGACIGGCLEGIGAATSERDHLSTIVAHQPLLEKTF